MIQLLILASVLITVSCQYGYKDDIQVEPHYSFEYSVSDPKTGDIKGQKEERNGEETKGEYYLMEPDGSMRVVQYRVEGKSGFVADIKRQARKPESKESSYYTY